MSTKPDFARSFFESMVEDFEQLLRELPIPDLYQSSHNIVAYTMLSICNKLAYPIDKLYNYSNLLKLCRQDIETISWLNESEKSRGIEQLQDAAKANALEGNLETYPLPPALIERWKNCESYVKFNDSEETLEAIMQRLDQSKF